MPTAIATKHQIVFGSSFPKELAGHFTGVKPVRAANSNMSVSSVGAVTRPASAQLSIAGNLKHVPLANKLTGPSHKPVTPVKVDRLEFFLADYPAHLFSALLKCFRFGFSIQFYGDRKPFESPNLKSALENPQIVSLKLKKELEAGRIAGPFIRHPFKNFRCSPLGIVPKKVPSEFRMIST